MWQRIKRFLAEDFGYYWASRSSHKPLKTQYSELRKLFSAYQYIPYQYVKHALYLDSFAGDIVNFLPPELIHRLQHRLNPRESLALVDDKRLFAELMRQAGLPTVDDLCYIRPGPAVYDSTTHQIVALGELQHWLASRGEQFILKPSRGFQGRNVFRLNCRDNAIELEGEQISAQHMQAALFSTTEFDEYVLQPLINQHADIAQLHPSSVNTIRIDTLVKNGRVFHSGAVLRMGRQGMSMDNWATGGLIAPIDLETGKLGHLATSKVKFGRQVVTSHPDTGVSFANLHIPWWQELIQLVASASLVLQPLGLLGWDVAITPTGPVLVEANHDYDVFLLQEGIGGLRQTAIGEYALATLDTRRCAA